MLLGQILSLYIYYDNVEGWIKKFGAQIGEAVARKVFR